MRLVFFGTPDLAVPSLERIVEEGCPPTLVVTRADRPKGRGLEAGPSPVRAAAERLGLPVATPARASSPEFLDRIGAIAPDLIVLVAYGQILSPALLALPRLGALNVHFSLLPRHRGAAPIAAAILAGDEITGVTTMWMTEGLDEGPTFLALETPIDPRENAGALGSRLAALGAEALARTIETIGRGVMVRLPQDSTRATYASKIPPDAGRLSLSFEAADFCRRVRAFTPTPGAFLEIQGGRLGILEAAPGEGDSDAEPGTILAVARDRGLQVSLVKDVVWLARVRPSGRREMAASDYANGARLRAGARLPVLESST